MAKIFTKIYTNKDRAPRQVKIVSAQPTGLYYGGYRVFAGDYPAGQAAAVLSDGTTQIPVLTQN